MKHLPYYLSMTTIGLAMMLMLYVAYLMFYPFKTVEVDQPYILHNTELQAGDLLQYTFDYCRFTDGDVNIVHQLRGTVAVRITDNVMFKLEDVGLRLRKGCGTATKGVPLPHKIPAGEYYLEEAVSYQVSPLQKISITLRTEEFTIIE